MREGRAVGAWVIDFKTDRVPPGGEEELLQKHASQLGLYRRVAAVLMELPVESVRCSLALVFVRSAWWTFRLVA